MKTYHLIFVIVISYISKAKGCEEPFEKCICGKMKYGGYYRYVLNCTNTGYTDPSILQRLPDKVEVLIFIGNDIPELPWNLFGTNNNTHLKIIDMSNNKIKDIRGKSYHRVSKVERLILNHNEIIISKETNHHHPRLFSSFESLEELHLTDAFADNSSEDLAVGLLDIFASSDLVKLRKLHLEQNGITFFEDPKVFCDLSSLLDLHLGDNKQHHITFHLDCLSHLRFLDLQKNSIASLNSQDLRILDKLPDRGQSLIIDISNNPFICSNKIEDLYIWLETTQVVVRNKNKLKCKNKNSTQESMTLIMDHYKNNCSNNNIHKIKNKRHILTENNSYSVLFLSCALFISICALIYTNREPIYINFAALLRILSSKIHYTTIGKQDAQEMEV